MFSSSSYAGWTKVGESVDGNSFYVDFERIRKHGGYVYYWELIDKLKPNSYGNLSDKTYSQVDCKLFRFKRLSFSFHKEPMGGGTGDISAPLGENGNWIYPSPNSIGELILKQVCNQ